METNPVIAPKTSLPDTIALPIPEQIALGNGIPVWVSSGVSQPLIRLSLMLEAGKWFEPKQEVSHLTARLLKSGTSKKTAAQIEEEVEYLGASLSVGHGGDFAEIAVFALTKHLEQMLVLVSELLIDASFPERELQHERNIRKQRLQLNREKTNYLAKVGFKETLFGSQHPYGYPRSEQSLDSVSRADLSSFHQQRYTPQGAKLFVTGQVDEQALKLIEQYLGGVGAEGTGQNGMQWHLPEYRSQERFISKPGSVQSAIRMGRFMPMPSHADHSGLRALNIVLGGYFGSRLMTNLRENKGYTYGVYSHIAHNRHQAYLNIATDVGQQYAEDAVQQIRFELDRLRNELVSESELELVRNYTLGVILSTTDGAFKSGQVVKDLIMSGRDIQAFDDHVNTIKTITPQRLKALAEQYLDPNDMTTVVAGSTSEA